MFKNRLLKTASVAKRQECAKVEENCIMGSLMISNAHHVLYVSLKHEG